MDESVCHVSCFGRLHCTFLFLARSDAVKDLSLFSIVGVADASLSRLSSTSTTSSADSSDGSAK